MKIGIDIRGLMEERYSGVSLYTLNLLHEIFRQDLKNKYVLFYNTSKEVKMPKFPYPNVKIFFTKFPNKIFNLALRFLKTPKLDVFLGNVDLLFFPNINFFAVSEKCKVVTTIHDLSFEIYPEFYSKKSRLWHRLVEPRKLCARSQKIISVSQSTKNILMDTYKISENAIRVIHSGISTTVQRVTYPEILSGVRKKYALPQKFVLCLGNVEQRKNVGSAVSAFLSGKLPEDLHLVISGNTTDKREPLGEKANEKIHYIGYVSEGDKNALYSLSRMFLYPSYYEGFGFPPLEAMACGVPTIVSQVSSLPEVAGNASILINPNNTNDIIRAINHLYANETLRENLIKKGLERVKFYDWDRSARELLELFHSI